MIFQPYLKSVKNALIFFMEFMTNQIRSWNEHQQINRCDASAIKLSAINQFFFLASTNCPHSIPSPSLSQPPSRTHTESENLILDSTFHPIPPSPP